MNDHFGYEPFENETHSVDNKNKWTKIAFIALIAAVVVLSVLLVCNVADILVECGLCGRKVFSFSAEPFFSYHICDTCYEEWFGSILD
jgi:hypothetical protein